MSPEMILKGGHDRGVDFYGMGALLYEMVFGYAPWPCRSLQEYIKGIYNKPLSFPYNAKIG